MNIQVNADSEKNMHVDVFKLQRVDSNAMNLKFLAKRHILFFSKNLSNHLVMNIAAPSKVEANNSTENIICKLHKYMCRKFSTSQALNN